MLAKKQDIEACIIPSLLFELKLFAKLKYGNISTLTHYCTKISISIYHYSHWFQDTKIPSIYFMEGISPSIHKLRFEHFSEGSVSLLSQLTRVCLIVWIFHELISSRKYSIKTPVKKEALFISWQIHIIKKFIIVSLS